VNHGRTGFTLVEVLVAITVLAVGVVAMAGSAGTVTRMVGRGKIDTRAVQTATQRMEMLRLAAYSTTPRCTAGTFVSGGPLTADKVTASWVVPNAGAARTVTVTVSYATPRGTRSETLTTVIEC
jgi:prepilin-type N-terminal cleavage/methylation domain-containing protein